MADIRWDTHNMKTLKQLTAERDAVHEELKRLNREIGDLQKAKDLPPLKKKYEGKYFKYRNGAGTDRWWVYSHVLEVDSTYAAKVYSFAQKGNWILINTDTEPFSTLGKQITEWEFNQKLREIRQSL